MTDVLVSNLSDEVIAKIDENTQRLGLTRSEYLQHEISRKTLHRDRKLTPDDVRRFSALIQDLKDPEVLRKAWN